MTNECCNCNERMQIGLDKWHWTCVSCGYEAATFSPSINQAATHALVDEAGRERGLRLLREKNFRKLISLIWDHTRPHTRRLTLLDVGAAHGWFVKTASEKFDALGIEPDHIVFEAAKQSGIPLKEGFFPDVLSPEERFDIIVFNDVFEHMPDVDLTLKSCKKHLNNQGLLVITLPSSDGFFYRMSKQLKRIGFGGSFDRMWQKGLPSPHLHYFTKNNLLELTQRYGFKAVATGELPSIRLDGLYSRISHIGGPRKARNILILLCVATAIPVIKCFHSDIAVVIVRKRES